MTLRLPFLCVLFLIGAGAGLFGDHFHVTSATTEYLDDAHDLPFIWDSPFYFPLMVGGATAGFADLRARRGSPRAEVDVRYALGGIAAVMGTYALTTFMPGTPDAVSVSLITALAVLAWCFIGDRYSIFCGGLAAVVGPIIEITLAGIDQFQYADGADSLFGVAPWLPPLYFAFGVVASVLGELAAGARRPASALRR